MSNYDQFRDKLREIFMMDHAELDFGIYRIMNQKRDEITKFLDKDLLPQVQKILGGATGNQSAADAKRMKEIEEQFGNTDILSLPDTIPAVAEYKELKARIANSGSIEELENEVFNHLTIFFSRYYDNGDFVSKRRYKDNAYAIPYNGEEVKLHWANSDQYYIKTSEYFQNYTFNVVVEEKTQKKKKKVHFVLKDVTTEQNNNKAASGMERRFALYQDEEAASIEVIQNADGEEELNIYFTYELMPKGTKQDALMADAFDGIKGQLPEGFKVLVEQLCPTEKNKKRTLLEKHLTDYTAKNSFDYFIHKDLGGFLRRELDFYIKNEVLLIDDLDEKHVVQQLSLVRAIKGVGEKIITMLAQIEDFQKRLWLKKKFVVQSDYCITLDRVPESFYAEICENEAQRKEWVRLFAIDEIQGDLVTEPYSEPLTEEFLRQNRYLVLDTAFFSKSFKHRLLSKMDDVDKNCNGLLINSENFQGVSFVEKTFTDSTKCVYLDPPYNTSEVGFVYKNNYRHSSWASMMYDRLVNCRKVLTKDGVLFITIDDEELYELKNITDQIFGKDNYIGTIVIESNPRGRGINSFYATCHEYCLAYAKNPEYVTIIDQELTAEQAKAYTANDEEEIAYRPLPFRRSGGWSTPQDRPNSEFSLFFDEKGILFAVGGERVQEVPAEYEPRDILVWNTIKKQGESMSVLDFEQTYPQAIKVLPIDTSGMRRVWRWSDRNKILQAGSMGDFILNVEKDYKYVQLKDRIKGGRKPKTLWDGPMYDSSSHGTNLIKELFGQRNLFGFPKSVYSTEDTLHSIVGDEEGGSVLDLFGGSGTTGHAVLNLNRKDNVNRKYTLCEMGEYFDKVTRARIEKVIYSEDWKDGKPISRKGISQCFKYIRLEQYEDTLNNLEVKKKGDIFDNDEDFHESYMLQYMMDMDTRDSLFNIERFVHPFDVKLKTTRDNELVETNVDMVETFNYLIGLEVDTIRWTHNDEICVVEGRLHRNGDKALIIWRDTEKVDNTELNAFFRRNDYHVKDSEFDVIYVNGDNTLQNQKRDDEHWKVVLIEEEFQKRMFEGC